MSLSVASVKRKGRNLRKLGDNWGLLGENQRTTLRLERYLETFWGDMGTILGLLLGTIHFCPIPSGYHPDAFCNILPLFILTYTSMQGIVLCGYMTGFLHLLVVRHS